MLPILFRIPGLDLPIYSYGLMMVIGFICAIQLAKYLARRCGIDPEIFVNAGLIALIAGIGGARLSHVLENLGQYTRADRSVVANFLDAINIRSGGLTYYGGFLLAFASLVFYAWKKKIPVRLGMDICAPCIVIGLGFGRIGCFLNGCCYGDTCELPWAVHFPYQSIAYEEEFLDGKISPGKALLLEQADGSYRLLTRDEIARGVVKNSHPTDPPIPVNPQAAQVAAAERSLGLHPAQLYSTFTAFMIAGIVLAYFTLPHAPGRAFAMMLMLEGSTRFILESLRVEPAVVGHFSLSMVIGLCLAALGLILWITFGILHKGPASPPGFELGQPATV